MTEAKKKLQCKRCSYKWESRLDNPEEVKKCPRCLSRNWDKEKK